MPDLLHAVGSSETFVERKIAHGERAIADVPANHASEKLPKVANVARIVPCKQVVADCRVGFWNTPGSAELV
jgi:hypothetical protein